MNDNSSDSVRLLNSSVVEERLEAVRLLSGLSPVRMDLFRVAFGDQDWRVRKEAVRIFLSLPGTHEFASDIVELLHDPENAGLRNSAIEILVSLGPLVVPELTAKITCGDPEVRKFAIDILGEIGGADCEEGVLNALSDEDINVRYAAVETLGKLVVEEAVEPLLDLMDEADTGLRFTILEALASIGKGVSIDRLSRFLEDRVLRKALLDCLGRIGGVDVLPYLVEGLADPMRKARESSLSSLGTLALSLPEAVKAALAGAPENLLDRLVELLNDPAVEKQRAAIRLASMGGGLKAAQSLLPLLEDDKLREDIISAFRSQEDRFFVQLLTEELQSDPMTRLYLVYLAGELHSAAGLQLTIDSLASSDPQLRYTAVLTLGKLGDERSIEPLVRCLKDENPETSDAAASSLGMFGVEYSEPIVSAITPLLDDQDAALRMRAVRILGSVEGPSVESALLMALKDPESEVRWEAIRALRGCSADTYVEGLKLALNDEVSDVRRLAAEALGASDGEDALPALSLAIDDQDPWVRAAAVRSLKNFPSEEATLLLSQGVADSVGLVVIAALETLAQRDNDSAQPYIEKALSHSDGEVVRAAIDLLAREDRSDCLETHSSGLLSHPHRDVRMHAAQTIARLCGKACQPRLEEQLLIETEPLVRQVLEEMLQQLQRSGS